jgi:hypothetical protein
VLTAFYITGAMMMEVASTSKTSVNLYQTTRRNNPKDSHDEEMTMIVKAASTSETSVNFYQTTRHNNPENSRQYIRMFVFLFT